MIIQTYKGRFLLVRQFDHGLQVGAMAQHWGNEEVSGFEPRDLLIEAAARHDNGWISLESRPAVHPETGEPLQFVDVSPHDDVPASRREIEEAVRSHSWVGLLVSLHRVGLYNHRYGTWKRQEKRYSSEEEAIVGEFLEEQERLQVSLARDVLDSLPPTPVTDHPHIWRNYLLLQVWDRLSLQLVWRLAADGEISPLPKPEGGGEVLRCTNRGEFTLALDPYPFDESPCELPVQTRLLPKRRYNDPADLLQEYLSARITTIECRAVRP